MNFTVTWEQYLPNRNSWLDEYCRFKTIAGALKFRRQLKQAQPGAVRYVSIKEGII